LAAVVLFQGDLVQFTADGFHFGNARHTQHEAQAHRVVVLGLFRTLDPQQGHHHQRPKQTPPLVFGSSEAIADYRKCLERALNEALADPPTFDWRRALRDGFGPSFQLSHHDVCNRRLKEKFAGLFASAFPRQCPTRRRRNKIRVGFVLTLLAIGPDSMHRFREPARFQPHAKIA
jgi:hypothetical protein